MKFAEVIIFDVLDKKGYSSPSMLRSSTICRWYTVRKGEQLFEVEAYDSGSFKNEALVDYISSLNSLPSGAGFFRKPVEVIQEREVTCVVRNYYAGEPVYTYFIRPGALPLDEAVVKIKGFEKVHRYLKNNKVDNLAPVSIMFFMTDGGEVLIDGFKCGPWVKQFDHLTVISHYLNPELSWPQQLSFFRNSFALKVLTGNPSAGKFEDSFPPAVKAFVEGIISSKNGYQENLSVLEQKYRPRNKGFFLRVAVLSAIVVLPLLAYLIRVLQSDSSWMGPELADKAVKKEKVEERDEFAFEPDAVEKIEVSFEFIQKIKRIREQMLAGNFKMALDQINLLSSVNLRKGELEILKELRAEYPEKRKADFENAISKSRTLITLQKYDEAILLLQDIVDRYKSGKDAEQAFAAIQKIKDLEESQKAQEKETLVNKVASLEKDRLMISKLEELQKSTFKKPAVELEALNRRLDLIRIECVTSAAKYLVTCAMMLNTAEKRLYEQLLQFENEKDKKKILKFFTDNVAGLGGVEAYDIIESGIEYRDSAGGGNFRFANVPPAIMYEVFKETSAVDVERGAYYLYLYCSKYGLTRQAEIEFKNIKSRELLKEADSLRDMKQARRDLFAGK